VLSRPDYATLRPSALSELRASLDIVEQDFLNGKLWITGDTLSLSDLHVVWVVRWALQDLGIGKIRGFTEEDLPNIHAW
jgi:glutathione S-transferase